MTLEKLSHVVIIYVHSYLVVEYFRVTDLGVFFRMADMLLVSVFLINQLHTATLQIKILIFYEISLSKFNLSHPLKPLIYFAIKSNLCYSIS